MFQCNEKYERSTLFSIQALFTVIIIAEQYSGICSCLLTVSHQSVLRQHRRLGPGVRLRTSVTNIESATDINWHFSEKFKNHLPLQFRLRERLPSWKNLFNIPFTFTLETICVSVCKNICDCMRLISSSSNTNQNKCEASFSQNYFLSFEVISVINS